MLKEFFYVGMVGALGAVMRYGVSLFCAAAFKFNFPLATLFVNFTGSFLIGILAAALLPEQNALRLFLVVGILGGFTTFSTFSQETLLLFNNGQTMHALANITLNITLCLLFVFLGFKAARFVIA